MTRRANRPDHDVAVLTSAETVGTPISQSSSTTVPSSQPPQPSSIEEENIKIIQRSERCGGEDGTVGTVGTVTRNDSVSSDPTPRPNRLDLADPTPGRDVGWAVADGETRPIREVLRERKRRERAQSKALREEAFRVRAGMQAVIQMCLCCYPLVLAETESQHEDWCPAHETFLSMKSVAERYAHARLDLVLNFTTWTKE
jgi:hypothetical protein